MVVDPEVPPEPDDMNARHGTNIEHMGVCRKRLRQSEECVATAAKRAALLAEDWPAVTELLNVPPGLPRTKPRALNYGLAQAVGEFVVVYDAEDRPSPDQLKAVVRAFRTAGHELAIVQAPLVGEGAQSWIGGRCALEYTVQFGRLLPAQALLGLPVMLGGTSNHFRRRAGDFRRLGRMERDGGCRAWPASCAQRSVGRNDPAADLGNAAGIDDGLHKSAFALAEGFDSDLAGAYAQAGTGGAGTGH